MNGTKLHVCLYGGLGNQLFQIGTALAVSRYSQERHLVLDRWRVNRYESSHLEVLDKLIDLTRRDISVASHISLFGASRIARLFGLKMVNLAFINDKNIINTFESSNYYRRLYFDGYFQDVMDNEIFNEVRNQLLKIISPKFLLAKENVVNRLVVHIRGGDFLSHSHGSVCDSEYYKLALETMLARSNFEDILVVTDDQKYSKKILEGARIQNTELVSNSDPFEDFLLISRSKHRILSNSTFGLWASELGNNSSDGSVICPRYFYPGSKRKFTLTNEISQEEF